MNRRLPIVVVFFSGLAMLVDYFFPRLPYIHGARELFLNWGRVALTCAMLLGVTNLLLSNIKKVMLQAKGWIYNLILIVSFAVTAFFALQVHFVHQGHAWLMIKGTDTGIAPGIFLDVYTPLSATMFSLVAFYIASVSYRAFRAKNLESVLLLSSAALVMIGSVPFGAALFTGLGLNHIFPHDLAWVSTKIQEIPMSSAQRGLRFGIALGIVSMSIKVLTGIDRSYFGEGEE